MNINIIEPYGYCRGVQRAFDLAIKTKEENPDRNVVVLGMLVHNEDALNILKKHGINTVFDNKSSLEELALSIKEPSIVILTAHGHGINVEKILKENGHTIVDATCPFVKNSLDGIRKEIENNNDVFYIGIKNHPETNAALSISDKIKFFEASDIKNINIENSNNPSLFVQSTINKEEIDSILKDCVSNKDFHIVSDICNASFERQEKLKQAYEIYKNLDVVIIVGGTNSNNTKSLFKIAQKYFKNSKVILIKNADEIEKKDFINVNEVLIASGASTPKEIVIEIKEKLLN